MANLPINPDVVRWARETAGLSVEEVVEKFKRKRVTAETVEAWENGDDSPTYAQLERLAYEIYKRPLAIFFFPEPPEEISPQQSFRTLPEYEIELMPARVRLLLRKAKALQFNLQELYEGVNPAGRQIVRDLNFDPDTPAEQIAVQRNNRNTQGRHYMPKSALRQVQVTDPTTAPLSRIASSNLQLPKLGYVSGSSKLGSFFVPSRALRAPTERIAA